MQGGAGVAGDGQGDFFFLCAILIHFCCACGIGALVEIGNGGGSGGSGRRFAVLADIFCCSGACYAVIGIYRLAGCFASGFSVFFSSVRRKKYSTLGFIDLALRFSPYLSVLGRYPLRSDSPSPLATRLVCTTA